MGKDILYKYYLKESRDSYINITLSTFKSNAITVDP